MINTEILEKTTKEYLDKCKRAHKTPTYKGMGQELNITGRTVANVVHGKYNGKAYGNKENYNRCRANNDFEVLREVFKEYTVNGIQ